MTKLFSMRSIGLASALLLIAVCGVVYGLGQDTKAQEAKPETKAAEVKQMEMKEFTVIGIAARTSNSKEMSGTGAIAQQWGRFIGEGILNKIPNRADSNLIALYTDYVPGQDLEYTFVIGAKVKPGTVAPEGMVAKKVPAGKYSIITSERGPAPQVLPAVWQKIWTMPKADLGDRAFQTDYELYDANQTDPQNLQAQVYVGVK